MPRHAGLLRQDSDLRQVLNDDPEEHIVRNLADARQFAFAVDELAFASDGRRYELGTPSVPSAAIARG